jgi:hypothetical protein
VEWTYKRANAKLRDFWVFALEERIEKGKTALLIEMKPQICAFDT